MKSLRHRIPFYMLVLLPISGALVRYTALPRSQGRVAIVDCIVLVLVGFGVARYVKVAHTAVVLACAGWAVFLLNGSDFSSEALVLASAILLASMLLAASPGLAEAVSAWPRSALDRQLQVSIWLGITLHWIVATVDPSSRGAGRWSGGLRFPNELANYILAMLILAECLALRPGWGGRTSVQWSIRVTGPVLIYFTGGRSALLGLIVLDLVVYSRSLRRPGSQAVGLLLGIGLFASTRSILGEITPQGSNVVSRSSRLATDGDIFYLENWLGGLKSFISSPLIGTGTEASKVYSTTYGESFEIHQTFIGVLAISGLVGAVAFTFLLSHWFKAVRPSLFDSPMVFVLPVLCKLMTGNQIGWRGLYIAALVLAVMTPRPIQKPRGNKECNLPKTGTLERTQ